MPRFRRDNIGFVFQFYNLLPSLNALDNVILPLLAKGMNWKDSRARGAAMRIATSRFGVVGMDCVSRGILRRAR